MKFKIQERKIPKSIDEYTIRTVKGFAWLPVQISKTEKVWLQRYELKEMYYRDYYFSGTWLLYDEQQKEIRAFNNYFGIYYWTTPGCFREKISPPKGMTTGVKK